MSRIYKVPLRNRVEFNELLERHSGLRVVSITVVNYYLYVACEAVATGAFAQLDQLEGEVAALDR